MQSRYNLDVIQMQFRCGLDEIYMQLGVVGEVGNKAISAFNSVEVEVEAELGKRMALSE